MFTTITINNNTYNLKLTAKSCVELENRLGTNPLNVISKLADTEEIPSLSVILDIFHYALVPMNHGITLADTYDLYDKYIEEGHTMLDFIPVILDIFKSSGFISNKEKTR